jgi:hypothetical protein
MEVVEVYRFLSEVLKMMTVIYYYHKKVFGQVDGIGSNEVSLMVL